MGFIYTYIHTYKFARILYIYKCQESPRMRVKPIAVIMSVEGTPNLR